MKKVYFSPKINIEELYKSDVLLDSPPEDSRMDNGETQNSALSFFNNLIFGS